MNKIEFFNTQLNRTKEQIEVDIKEIIARTAQESTVNDILLEPTPNAPNEWKELIQNILDNNDLLKLIKGDCRLKSLYGVNYVGFEIWDGNILIFNSDLNNQHNKTLRINQQKEILGSIYRKVAIIDNNEYLTFIEHHTPHKIIRRYQTSTGASTILINDFITNAPTYFKELYKNKEITHNYGVLCIKEFLNRTLIDFESRTNDKLTDWYAAKHLINEFNEILDFSSKERKLNRTRIVGNVIDTQRTNESDGLFSMNQQQYNLLNSDLILSTMSDRNTFEIMQSDYDGSKHIKTANDLLELIFKLSGYVWNQGDHENYINTETSTNLNRATFETTKMKVELYTNDWIDFFKNIAIAYFKVKYYGDQRLSSEQQKKHNKDISLKFNNFVNFKIISNLIKDYNDNTARVLTLYTNGLMDLATAVSKIYTEHTPTEQKKILQQLEEQQKNNE